MSIKKMLVLIALLVIAMFVLSACAGPAGPVGPAGSAGPAGPQGPAGTAPKASELSCTDCHNDTTLISGPAANWSQSLHGSGTVFIAEGTNPACTACHSGNGFSAMVAAGVTFDKMKTADPNPTPQDCRACHQIHTTYTKADFALETTSAVTLVVSGKTFDGGMGNLCANCHQPRRALPAATDGKVNVNSTHWGPHYGIPAAMLLGTGGATDGTLSTHYTTVTDTCVACHMGDGKNHTFAPAVATCVKCHADAKDFDMKGTQTAVTALLGQLKTALQAKGLLDKTGGIVVGNYSEKQAGALWNYLFVVYDKSNGVHNSVYTTALLQAGLDALK
jgi:hypothetical protein